MKLVPACRNGLANSARAAPSNRIKRHGVSLPWSGTRTAISRISAICSGLGPGSPMALAEADLRLLRKAKGEDEIVQSCHDRRNLAVAPKTQ